MGVLRVMGDNRVKLLRGFSMVIDREFRKDFVLSCVSPSGAHKGTSFDTAGSTITVGLVLLRCVLENLTENFEGES